MADSGDAAASVTAPIYPTVHEIEEVDLRSVFPREDRTFTPWLSQPEILARLARTLGLEIEFEAMTLSVAPGIS
jgi:hypothetical protein